ncbi:MAG: hypothetical protein PHQ86_07235 [Dehalococcoidales bacterium]|nr:hypothetical protein [Dehalococcoidales bacterium]
MNKLVWLSSPLVGLYFVVSYYANNIVLFLPVQVLSSVVGAVILCSLITLAMYLLSKDKLMANLISVLIAVGVFTWGYNNMVSLVFMFGAIIIYFLKINNKIVVYLNRIALLLLVGLLIVPLFNIAVYHASLDYKPINDVISDTDSPDIYYIILDSYASNDIMASLGYDNSYFTGYLKEDGFVVEEDAFCNYPRTYISVPSILAMDYIDDPGDREYCYQSIQTNKVFEQAHELGYKVINLSSNWSGTEKILYADENYEVPQIINNSFSSQLWGSTLLRHFGIFPSMAEIQRKVILYQLDTLRQLPQQEDQPRFIFAHILIPHHACALFHGNGEIMEPNPSLTTEYVYFQHVDYINNQLEAVIDDIIGASPDSIIILQADEGISTSEFYNEMYSTGWVNDTKLMKQRAFILSAYYLPREIEIPQSSVNTFRTVFREFLGCDYENLDEIFYYPKVYITKGTGNPSKEFYDATDIIK